MPIRNASDPLLVSTTADPAGSSAERPVSSASTTTPAPSSSPPSAAVRLRRAGLTVVVLGLLFAILYAKAIPCIFARVVHQPCPGCGSTRAVLCLLHGDLHGLFTFNPLGPVISLLLGTLALQAFVSMLQWGDFRDAGEGRIGLLVKRGILIVGALEVLLWIARFFGVLGGPVPV
jgi:hypothetical protein